MTTKMFQASIGQKVTFPIGPEEYITGTVKVRSLDSFRRVILLVEHDSDARYVVFEFYARPYDDTAERQEAARLADQHAKAEQERQRQAREEAKLFEDAERAMVKQAKEQIEAERRAELDRQAADKRAAKLLADAEKRVEQARQAADKRAAKLAADVERSAAKRAAKEQKAAAKQAERDSKAAKQEEAELRERALLAEAEERVSQLNNQDPCAGWTMAVTSGETTKRSTATRTAVGTVLLPGIGTAIGFMAKKGSSWVYLQMTNADGVVVSSHRHPADRSAVLNARCVRFNRRHAIDPDGTTESQRDDRKILLKRQVKLLRKSSS